MCYRQADGLTKKKWLCLNKHSAGARNMSLINYVLSPSPLSVSPLPLNSVGSYKTFHAITHSSEFLGQGIGYSKRLHLQRTKKGTRKILFTN